MTELDENGLKNPILFNEVKHIIRQEHLKQ